MGDNYQAIIGLKPYNGGKVIDYDRHPITAENDADAVQKAKECAVDMWRAYRPKDGKLIVLRVENWTTNKDIEVNSD